MQGAAQPVHQLAVDRPVQASVVAHRLQGVCPGLSASRCQRLLDSRKHDCRFRMVEHQSKQSDPRVFVVRGNGLVNYCRLLDHAGPAPDEPRLIDRHVRDHGMPLKPETDTCQPAWPAYGACARSAAEQDAGADFLQSASIVIVLRRDSCHSAWSHSNQARPYSANETKNQTDANPALNFVYWPPTRRNRCQLRRTPPSSGAARAVGWGVGSDHASTSLPVRAADDDRMARRVSQQGEQL